MTTTQFLLAKAKPLQIQLLVNEKLPKELLHAAVGQLLGDGHADKSSPTSNTRLSWSFGTAYKEYAYFISNLFDSYVSKGVYTVNAVAKKVEIVMLTIDLKQLHFLSLICYTICFINWIQ
jgi:hypothetical protein